MSERKGYFMEWALLLLAMTCLFVSLRLFQRRSEDKELAKLTARHEALDTRVAYLDIDTKKLYEVIDRFDIKNIFLTEDFVKRIEKLEEKQRRALEDSE